MMGMGRRGAWGKDRHGEGTGMGRRRAQEDDGHREGTAMGRQGAWGDDGHGETRGTKKGQAWGHDGHGEGMGTGKGRARSLPGVTPAGCSHHPRWCSRCRWVPMAGPGWKAQGVSPWGYEPGNLPLGEPGLCPGARERRGEGRRELGRPKTVWAKGAGHKPEEA